MSDRINLVAEPRDVAEKKAKQLRREGWVPAIIYGRSDTIHVQFDKIPLRRALRTAGMTQLIDVEIDGEQRTVLAREIQQHVTRGNVLHVDFLEVDLKATIRAEAELVSVGEAGPTSEGLGVATLALRTLEIECLPDALISQLEVDFSLIETPDDVIYVSDLVAPEGVTIVTDPETAVARFEYVQEEEEEEEELLETFIPAADDVEVIGRGKDEEEEFEEFEEFEE
jgi:large subunit ribosomal protein L25